MNNRDFFLCFAARGGGGNFGGKVIGMCHFEKIIGAIIPGRKLKKGPIIPCNRTC